MNSKKLERGIVITTCDGNEKWLYELLDSIQEAYDRVIDKVDKYPILVVVNDCTESILRHKSIAKVICNDWNGWEVGGIARGAEQFDQFIHLMDTCTVQDYTLFYNLFEGKQPVMLCDKFYSYLGRYNSKSLKSLGIPVIKTKQDAIWCEHHWHQEYIMIEGVRLFTPSLPITTEVFEERHGRTNMVLQNGFITKYKATWK